MNTLKHTDTNPELMVFMVRDCSGRCSGVYKLEDNILYAILFNCPHLLVLVLLFNESTNLCTYWYYGVEERIKPNQRLQYYSSATMQLSYVVLLLRTNCMWCRYQVQYLFLMEFFSLTQIIVSIRLCTVTERYLSWFLVTCWLNNMLI